MQQVTEECYNCTTTKNIMLCKHCNNLSCKKCLLNEKLPKYMCPSCNKSQPSSSCGVCGNTCSVLEYESIAFCGVCKKSELGSPQTLLINLPKDYYLELESIHEILENVQGQYTLLDKIIGHVKYARVIGLLGLPEIERKLEFLLATLKEINEEVSKHFSIIKEEAFAELRSSDNFKNIQLSHFRVYNAKVENLKERVSTFNSIISDYIETSKENICKILPEVEILNYHLKNYSKIREHLAEHERYVIAIVPNVNLCIKSPKKITFEACLVFCETALHIIPMEVKHVPEKKTKIDYDYFKEINIKYNPLTGIRLIINHLKGKIEIRGTKDELDNIKGYIEKITQDIYKLMIGSPKEIEELARNIPSIYAVKNKISKFLLVVNGRLFTNPEQKTRASIYTINEAEVLATEIDKRLFELDNLGRSAIITPEEYLTEHNKLRRKKFEILSDTRIGLNLGEDKNSFGLIPNHTKLNYPMNNLDPTGSNSQSLGKNLYSYNHSNNDILQRQNDYIDYASEANLRQERS